MYMLNTNSNINDSTTNSPDNGADGVQFSVLALQTSELKWTVCLNQRQIGGLHNAYFKQESSLYLLLKEIQLYV